MKAKSLQFGKAMSAAMFILLLCAAGMKNALAQNQVATLQHDGAITGTYYGENALTSAYNAASDGDIITLSSGTFGKCNIAKSITIRGAGCEWDSLTGVAPTIISGDFYLQREAISIEGVEITGTISLRGYWPLSYGTPIGCNNSSFVKCYISKIMIDVTIASRCNQENCQFVNCVIKNFEFSGRIYSGDTYSYYYMTNLSIINSVVRVSQYDHWSASLPTCIHNSIVLFDDAQPIKM